MKKVHFYKNSVGDVVYQYDLDQAMKMINSHLMNIILISLILVKKEMSEYNKISMQIFNLLKRIPMRKKKNWRGFIQNVQI